MCKIITAHALRLLLATAFLTSLATASFAQSAADPTGEPPIGIEEKSGAKGPSLTGVLAVKLIGSNGLEADGAEVVVRLRRGSLLLSFFAEIDHDVFFDTDEEKAQLQDDVLAAVRNQVLGGFFQDQCGRLGTGCPLVDLVLKQADEFGLSSDATNQYVIMDVTLATTKPL